MAVFWVTFGVIVGCAWLVFVVWMARRYKNRAIRQTVGRLQGSDNQPLREWASTRGYKFRERDDSWLSFTTRPPFLLKEGVVGTNGEYVDSGLFASAFDVYPQTVNEQVNDVVTGSRHGRDFVRFDIGHLVKFTGDPGPAYLRTVLATKFEHDVPYLALARRIMATRTRHDEPIRLESPPGEEHHVAFSKRHKQLTSVEAFKYAILSRRFTEWLQQQEVFYNRRNLMAFVLDNGWLYLIQRKRPDPSLLDEQIDFLMALADKLDEQARNGFDLERYER